VMSNNVATSLGNTFKAGNGLVVTHQSVWPEIEFTQPYMCEDEFNSIYDPIEMFTTTESEGSTLSSFLISATPSFKPMYLMPVPDFYVDFMLKKKASKAASSLPEVPDGQFQSSGFRTAGITTWVGSLALGSLSASNSVLIVTGSTLIDRMFDIEFNATVTNTSAALAQAFVVSVSGTDHGADGSISTAQWVDAYVSSPVYWDSNKDTVTLSLKGTIGDFGFSYPNTLYVNINTMASAVAATYNMYFTIRVKGNSGIFLPSNLINNQLVENVVSLAGSQTTVTNVVHNISDSGSVVAVTNVPHVITDSGSTTVVSNVPHVITDSGSTVAVSNTVNVAVTNVPHVVSDAGSVSNVTVLSQPISVVIDDTVPVAVSARVQGVLTPDTPVYVSSYFV